jgi:hypothetical protein
VGEVECRAWGGGFAELQLSIVIVNFWFCWFLQTFATVCPTGLFGETELEVSQTQSDSRDVKLGTVRPILDAPLLRSSIYEREGFSLLIPDLLDDFLQGQRDHKLLRIV